MTKQILGQRNHKWWNITASAAVATVGMGAISMPGEPAIATMPPVMASTLQGLLTTQGPHDGHDHQRHPAPEHRKAVDIAICLDTSGSMTGLIDAARMKLWDIVNDFSDAKPMPTLRVALLTFGNDGHNPEDGWVRVDQPFTQDLDRVSEQLFALSTNGGTELVGRVLYRAVSDLEWAETKDALKVIVVAGNESAEQDDVIDFRYVCDSAKNADTIINAIYCGNPEDTIAPAWREVAESGNGQFVSIDQNQTVVIATPFDEQLATLSVEVNVTYIPFGADGQRGMQNQTIQDSNSSNMNSAAAASRARTKASANYQCSWDLVDACNSNQVELKNVKTEDLPENMQSMTISERTAYLKEVLDRRETIQKKIQKVSVQRNGFLAKAKSEMSAANEMSFDHILRNAIRKQAIAKGFQFEISDKEESTTENAGEVEIDTPNEDGC